MNKQKLAQQIDHTLKAAGHQKNVIKGHGWHGRGTRYYTGGFFLGTDLSHCVTVGHRVRFEILPLSLTMAADDELSEKGREHKRKIIQQTRSAIDAYAAALAGFVVEERTNTYGLPYLVVTGGEEA